MRRLVAVSQVFAVVAATVVATNAIASAAPGPPAPDTPVAHELLRNGGFENATTSWTLSGAAKREPGRTGSGLAVSSATGTAWEGGTSASFGVDVRRIGSVRVSGFVQLDDVVQGATADNAAKISIAFVDATGKRTWKGVSLTGTQDWTERADVHTVPAGTVSAFLSVALDRARGTARFDDLTVRAESWVNLVGNPSFELTTPSTETCPAPAWCTPYLSATYQVDSTTAFHGTRSLRIDASPTQKIGGFVTVPLDQKTWPVVHVSAKVKLDRVETADYTDFPGGLRVSIGFLHTDANGASVYSASGLLNGVLTGSRDWTTISGSFRVPPLMTKLQVVPAIQNATGTAWVDDVRVTPESPWIAPDTQTKSAAAGTSAKFLTTVTNRRATADSLQLAVDGPGVVTPARTPVLQPGESAIVSVSVPANASSVLTATPAGDATLAQQATFKAEQATSPGGAPRVYSTPAQLDALKQRIDGQDWARKAFNDVVKTEADAWLTRPLDQPVNHGGWSGNFKCPGTNTSLEFNYNSPKLHRCPIDGRTHTGDLLDAAWVEIWHNNAAQAVADLGLAHRVTGDARYAAKARDILVYYAERFLSVPMNQIYGRVHYQSLDEAVASIGLIDGYDLIRDTLPESDRVDISLNLLRPLAELVRAYPTVTSNFQAWTVAAVHGAGSAIGDEGLRGWALDNPEMGTEFLLNKARMADGWWWEGAASYHVYAVQALTSLAISARNLGDRDYTVDERFRSMHTTLLPYLHPDLTIPAAGDGGTWGRRFGPSFAAMAEWAFAEYGTRDFATGLSYAYTNLGRPRADRWALRFGADSVPSLSGPRQPSATFGGLGETVLRSSDAPNLVPNPGFEEASLSNANALAFWQLDGGTWTDRRLKGSAWQKFPLDGTRLAHLKLQAMAKGRGSIDAVFLNDRWEVGRASLTIGAATWSAREVGLDVPPLTRAVKLTVRGDVTVDDIDLFADDLLDSGGFEEPGTWQAEGAAEVSPLAYRGSSAAKITGGLSRNSWSTDVPVTGGNVTSVRLDARTFTPLVPLRDDGGARLELSFVTPSGVSAPAEIRFHDLLGWRTRTLSAAVPKDAIVARVSLVVENAAGVALFDDVRLGFAGAVDPFQANALRLDHGVAGGTHGHADKLHLDVVGGGGLQSTDLGQIYGVDNADLTSNWYRESVSHNTVVVDGRSQDRNIRGALEFFGTTPRLKVVDAKADKPYAAMPDVSLRRAELMTDEYTVDVFDARGSSVHRFDQSWHGVGDLTVSGAAMTPPSCGTCVLDPNDKDFGYDELRFVAEGTASDGAWQAEWKTPQSVLSMRALEPAATRVLRTTGPGLATDGKQIPFVLARRDGSATRFTTVLETRSAAAPSAIVSAQRLRDGHVRVQLAGDRRDDVLYDGGYALVRRVGDRPLSIDLLNRSTAEVDGRTWLSASRKLTNASAVFAGDTLRLAVQRTADRGQVTITVHAPGVRTVELNNQPVSSVTRHGDLLKVTFTVG